MPSISSRTVPLDREVYHPVAALPSPAPPQESLSPSLNTTMRCPLPPIYAATDNLRQFYTGGQTPQYRVLPVTPLSAK